MSFSRSNFFRRPSSSTTNNRNNIIEEAQSSSSRQQNNHETIDGSSDEQAKRNSTFECNICLEVARDAVVTMCGHLFCWPCLHQWMFTSDRSVQGGKTCPVCKSAISRDKTIPIYGRGNDSPSDPRDKLPPRPNAQRTEPPPQSSTYPTGNIWATGGGFHVSFGMMASWPHSIQSFWQEFNLNERETNPDYDLMWFFQCCGVACIVWHLLLAIIL